jgi:hypothetical protein
MDRFDEILVDRLTSRGMLAVFAEPAFQILLRKAQLTAASSGNEDDFMLLARLLEERAEVSNRETSAVIDRAVQIIQHIDDEALNALTVVVSITQFISTSGSIADGFKSLDSLFGQVNQLQLPVDADWIDHLETLGLLRPMQFGSRVSMRELWQRSMPGYFSIGVPPGDLEFLTARLERVGITPASLLVSHELKPGSVRVAAVSMQH